MRVEADKLIITDQPAVQEQGQHYLIVEYVSGGSLVDVLAMQRHLPSNRAIELALDLADALMRTHRLASSLYKTTSM